MTTPLTSPKPDAPTGSSNPVSWKSWFIKISDWIAGMSPPGATVYDTGWVAITPASGFGGEFRAARVGRVVHVWWYCTTALAASQVATLSNSLPAQIPPPERNEPAALFGASAQALVGEITTSGSIIVRNAHPSSTANHRGSVTYFI